MKKRILSILLSMIILASFGSCSDTPVEETSDNGTGNSVIAETEPETEPEPEDNYVYPEADLGGADFTFLNLDECNWANRLLVPEESNGELINDEMFNRNLRIDDRYNTVIKEITTNMDGLTSELKKSVNSGDNLFDVSMVRVDNAGSLMTDKFLCDLAAINSLNLQSEWWDRTVVSAVTLKNKCYIASSDISLFPFEATWVLFFNEDNFTNLGIEFPYDLVRAGKWTFDKMTEIAEKGADLNGQDSFAYDELKGTAHYGMLSHSQFTEAAIFGAGQTFLSTEGGLPVFDTSSEQLLSICEKIAKLGSTTGAYIDRANAHLTLDGESPSTAFKNGRFLLLSETLGHLSNLRDFESDFGVLPIPKLSEEQEKHYSMMATWGTLMTAIPTTSQNPEQTGIILDALAYDSYRNLMSPYYDTYLSSKGMRNEDSAQMLQIIRETRTVNVGRMFDWTTALHSTIDNKLINGDSSVSSVFVSTAKATKKKIEKTLDSFGD